MLIPYENPDASSYQERYNKKQSRGRIVIECSFGILKNLFQCLRYGLRYDASKCCKIILACACLHNLRFRFAEPDPSASILDLVAQENPCENRTVSFFGLEESEDEAEQEQRRKPSEKQALMDGKMYRERLAQQYFG